MTGIISEISAFRARKSEAEREARQRVALALLAGVDLCACTSPAAVSALGARLERLLERERLKGLARHWSYDLNRHIALKQALDKLRGRRGPAGPARTEPRSRKAIRRPKAP